MNLCPEGWRQGTEVGQGAEEGGSIHFSDSSVVDKRLRGGEEVVGAEAKGRPIASIDEAKK